MGQTSCFSSQPCIIYIAPRYHVFLLNTSPYQNIVIYVISLVISLLKFSTSLQFACSVSYLLKHPTVSTCYPTIFLFLQIQGSPHPTFKRAHSTTISQVPTLLQYLSEQWHRRRNKQATLLLRHQNQAQNHPSSQIVKWQ